MFRCFFFNDTATTEIYTLSLHDALPISRLQPRLALLAALGLQLRRALRGRRVLARGGQIGLQDLALPRSEEHTSELQSRQYLVCRLLLEKKKNTTHADSRDKRPCS